ncbi:ankyrin domain protein [Acanthamoeba castellanii str. Neff]|uniref:Ankyrin domain protein n=1 Tax=Acanthamoeba castellanii (strain ATCC 30010 / Neff) TaxID=1257118 RepID=L8GHW9_ACACF|nr:ankyrin domain protein [Acanthamoeba castellanii str. Neff]ELR11786.1 ankyrin domain protein [Acanthamoeba castellanii str. Neff]
MQKEAGSQMTLLYAASRGYDAQVGQLINKKSIVERDDQGNTPLHLASGAGHVAVVKQLVKADGVDLNAQNDQGKTALHQAVWRNQAEVIKLLLGASARTDVKDKDGRLPRDLARDRDIKDLLPKPEGDNEDAWDLGDSDSD